MDHQPINAPTAGPQSTHVMTSSQQTRMVECERCRRNFQTVKALRRHISYEHNRHLSIYKCEWCEKRYQDATHNENIRTLPSVNKRVTSPINRPTTPSPYPGWPVKLPRAKPDNHRSTVNTRCRVPRPNNSRLYRVSTP